MGAENIFKNLLVELDIVNDNNLFSQENEGYIKRENTAKPILEKMIKAYNSDFADVLIKELMDNLYNWKGFFLCKFLQKQKEIKAIKPLIKLLTTLDSLDGLFEEVTKTLIEYGELASPYLVEEYNKRISHKQDIMDLLEIFIENGGSEKDIVIESANSLTSSEIELYVNLLAESKNSDYLPILKELRKKYRKLFYLRREIDHAIDALSSKEKTHYKSTNRYWEENFFELHKQARKAEKDNKLKDAYDIYEYLAYSDMNNFKSLYGKARVGFKLKKYDYEIARLALGQAIDNGASSVWINEIKLLKKEIKEKLIQLNDFDEGDDYKWMEFVCEKCGERQILRTGRITIYYDKSNDVKESYEYEIKCKKCKSKKMKLSKYSQFKLFLIALSNNEHPDIVKSSDTVLFDNKEIKINKLYKFIKNQLKKRKKDTEFYLKSANAFRNMNFWNEALELYKISQKNDPLIIANYYFLIKANAFRYYDYNDNTAREIALSYLEKLKSLPIEDLDYTFMDDSFNLDDFIEKMEYYLKNNDKEN